MSTKRDAEMTLEEVEKILTGTPKEVFPDEKSEEKFKQIKIACHPLPPM